MDLERSASTVACELCESERMAASPHDDGLRTLQKLAGILRSAGLDACMSRLRK